MHKYKTETSRRTYKAGYVVIKGIMDGKEWACKDFEMSHAETTEGLYIGDSKWAYRLCNKRGITPELRTPNSNVCSIGFCEKEQKWFGWSHRAIFGFGIGDIAKEGDCCTTSGFIEEYALAHPELDKTVPVGFEAKTLEDAKRMAIAFAESVS
ncbi:MAG: hypothetical protein COA96_10185 [SAR86 cluster bacterium]|uniref:Uncharacterized protein n=1 Tax=SAR86 cluster bacterium TaxID=2030880 RepID=A0A2A5AXS5_9GAMM|nr:MAG: hypothetical protein COA96_10185 [SAR86 cluster bacterium]